MILVLSFASRRGTLYYTSMQEETMCFAHLIFCFDGCATRFIVHFSSLNDRYNATANCILSIVYERRISYFSYSICRMSVSCKLTLRGPIVSDCWYHLNRVRAIGVTIYRLVERPRRLVQAAAGPLMRGGMSTSKTRGLLQYIK